MARSHAEMTEQEAREELARRHHRRGGDPYESESRDAGTWPNRYGLGAAPLIGGYVAPFLPPAYPGPAYGPDAGQQGYDYPHGGGRFEDDRGLVDRAGDKIASWFGDDAATARRKDDHRGRGPKGYVRTDARIEEDIHDRLTDAPYVGAREITVTVKDREITLDGTVDSRRAKRHAEDYADGISGVTHVQNTLRVKVTM